MLNQPDQVILIHPLKPLMEVKPLMLDLEILVLQAIDLAILLLQVPIDQVGIYFTIILANLFMFLQPEIDRVIQLLILPEPIQIGLEVS
jgi:hypothetical protein